MTSHTRPDDLDRLHKAGLSASDIAHSRQVADIALELAQELDLPLDLELVARGALFHDLGKGRAQDITHGVVGHGLALDLGLPYAVAEVARKHVRAGPPRGESLAYGLPFDDYSLGSWEEKLVVYADKLADILAKPGLATHLGEARLAFVAILEAWPNLAKDPASQRRYVDVHDVIEGAMTAGLPPPDQDSDAIFCHCHRLTYGQVAGALAAGATTLAAIKAHLGLAGQPPLPKLAPRPCCTRSLRAMLRKASGSTG